MPSLYVIPFCVAPIMPKKITPPDTPNSNADFTELWLTVLLYPADPELGAQLNPITVFFVGLLPVVNL